MHQKPDNLICSRSHDQVSLPASWLLNEIKVPLILPVTLHYPGFIP